LLALLPVRNAELNGPRGRCGDQQPLHAPIGSR
jgi:hypothetical protein